jgi:uncharacterized sulfatase
MGADDVARPNIVWITSEDNGPQLGAYGDRFATTPHLDQLAARGVIYRHAWSNAPVCAPARTTIISGVYPPATGAEHMRSQTRLPAEMQMFPELLRQAGYYCTNNSKEDYNLQKTGKVWDESSPRAHWKNRAPNQPFFAVFNSTVTHESAIRKRPHQPVHDPQQVRVPAYHPDTPEVRQDWAQYYDQMTVMDAFVGEKLQELADAGLTEDTIVFYYGDHGPGMPRCKRWPYNSGLQVPLIVFVPDKFQSLRSVDYQNGGASDRLVSFVDLAPTVLSLAGIQPPTYLQGHAFLGPFATAPPEFMFGFRGRMDERYDTVRSVTNGRYVYLRQFMPHRIYGQYLDYMFQTPTTRVWRSLFDQNKLNAAQARFWQPKPSEELYDLYRDPDEIENLAESPDHQAIRQQLAGALRQWQIEIRDLGLMPEPEMHRLVKDEAPYQYGHSSTRYPVESVVEMAWTASDRADMDIEKLLGGVRHDHSAVRYWALTGFLIRGEAAVREHQEILERALDDESPSVQIGAAEALARFGDPELRQSAVERLVELASLETQGLYVALASLNALDALRPLDPAVTEQLRALPRTSDSLPNRLNGYVPRIVEHLLGE